MQIHSQKFYFKFCTFLLIIFFFGSCSLLDSPETTPAFLLVSDPELIDSDPVSPDIKPIVDVLVQAGPTVLGTFAFPAQIPSLQTGIQKVRFFAGVIGNGNVSSRVIYPFISSIDTVLNLVAGEPFAFKPVFKPNLERVVHYKENFSADTFKLKATKNNQSVPQIRTETGSNGMPNRFLSLRMFKDTLKNVEFMGSQWIVAPNSRNQSLYIQFDYRSSVPFLAGMLINFSNNIDPYYKITIFPSTKWKRIYIYMGEENARFAEKTNIKFLIGGSSDGKQENYLDIDNVRFLSL